VHAAAGGLGLMAVQVAAALGCRVIGTAGSEEKCLVAEKAGAAKCLNYKNGAEPIALWGRILELTEGRGVDLVFDPVGLINESLKCLAHRGRILVIGFAGREGEPEKIAMNRVLLKQASLIGYVSHAQTESNISYPSVFASSSCDIVPDASCSGSERAIGATHKKRNASGMRCSL
jgi:NADPH:quinone reductase